MSAHFLAKAASVLGSPRECQERYLTKRGWMRLVARADVWFNPSRPGADKHDVFLFRFAVVEAARESTGDYLPKVPRVHHHPGATQGELQC